MINYNDTMNTMTQCINKAIKNGYITNFTIKMGKLFSNNEEFLPNEVIVENYYRFEGHSDPGDNAIMYVIETTNGTKGILVDAYGPYSDFQVHEFMMNVPIIKKNAKEKCSEYV